MTYSNIVFFAPRYILLRIILIGQINDRFEFQTFKKWEIELQGMTAMIGI